MMCMMSMMTLLPLVTILAIFVVCPALLFWFILRNNRARHEERMAMIEKGLVPPPESGDPMPAVVAKALEKEGSPDDSTARNFGNAAGIVLAGLGFLLRSRFDLSILGILLTAGGAGYLVRGIVGIVRSRRPS